ncbi:MAG TPA: DUF1674 domain-containing protein, partial [Novosphingobium sp.]|nr:DUF1674 domain-containing protein [Novosphingobium sp.]
RLQTDDLRPIRGCMKRATRRPVDVKKPAHWTNPPVPEPKPLAPSPDPLDPTRYGDWERNGIAVDF